MGDNLSRSSRESLYTADELIHILFLVRTLRTQLQDQLQIQSRTKMEQEIFNHIKCKIPTWIQELNVIDEYSDLVDMLARDSLIDDETWQHFDTDLRIFHEQMVRAHHAFAQLSEINEDRYFAILEVIERFIAVLA